MQNVDHTDVGGTRFIQNALGHGNDGAHDASTFEPVQVFPPPPLQIAPSPRKASPAKERLRLRIKAIAAFNAGAQRAKVERRRSSQMAASRAKKIRANYTDGGVALAAAGKAIFSGAVVAGRWDDRLGDLGGRLATV